jgi:cobalt-zinc-cadmium efflux system membrane fusion protein
MGMTMESKFWCGRLPREHRIRIPRALVVAVTLAACAALITGCSKSENPQSTTKSGNVTLTAAQLQHIRLYTVAQSTFHKTVETTGSVDFDHDQSTSVLAPFSGPVSRLLVSAGQKVKKGQPMATVASPDFAAAIGAYRKAVTSARTARRLADMDKDLLAHDGISRREEEQAQTDAIGAEADRDAALQALVSLNIDAGTIKDIQAGRPVSRIEGVIRSPIDGTVAEKLITPGQLLQAGSTPCFTVADLSRVWVMAQIFDTDLGSVGVGDRAQVITGIGEHNFAGTVDNVATIVDPDTRSVAVRVVVKNPGHFLKKQMYVRVRIEDNRQSAGLLVPDSAVLRDDENMPFVYVVQRDGSFARRSVTMGQRVADRYLIPTGLRPGDRIVVDGAIFVQFMQNQ